MKRLAAGLLCLLCLQAYASGDDDLEGIREWINGVYARAGGQRLAGYLHPSAPNDITRAGGAVGRDYAAQWQRLHQLNDTVLTQMKSETYTQADLFLVALALHTDADLIQLAGSSVFIGKGSIIVIPLLPYLWRPSAVGTLRSVALKPSLRLTYTYQGGVPADIFLESLPSGRILDSPISQPPPYESRFDDLVTAMIDKWPQTFMTRTANGEASGYGPPPPPDWCKQMLPFVLSVRRQAAGVLLSGSGKADLGTMKWKLLYAVSTRLAACLIYWYTEPLEAASLSPHQFTIWFPGTMWR